MELKQLKYFVSVVEHGSMGKAALALGVVTSALSQQISRLESELAIRLLVRTSGGVVPTEAGLAFCQQAQLTLRHADDAILAARSARLSGHVSVGLAPSTASVIGLPFLRAMQERYPEVRLRLVESLSGHLESMLIGRQIDLAILFRGIPTQRWSFVPLLDEHLFLIGHASMKGMPSGSKVALSKLGGLPLILPSGSHGLRALLDSAFRGSQSHPQIALEVDGLAMLMDAVRGGLGATIQPGAALAHIQNHSLVSVRIADKDAVRPNLIVSVSDSELSPAGLAARVVLADVSRQLVLAGDWPGASLRSHNLHKK